MQEWSDAHVDLSQDGGDVTAVTNPLSARIEQYGKELTDIITSGGQGKGMSINGDFLTLEPCLLPDYVQPTFSNRL